MILYHLLFPSFCQLQSPKCPQGINIFVLQTLLDAFGANFLSSVENMVLVTLALCVLKLFSLVYANQYLNAEHQNDLHENLRQPFFDFGNEERGELDQESRLSRRQPELRSVSSSDPSSNLKLAAFNVQTFGTKKMATPGVPGILVKVSIGKQMKSRN